MNKVFKFLKYFFGYSGIMYAEDERPKRKSLTHALKRLFTGAVQYGAPSQQVMMAAYRMHRPLVRYKCKVCGVHFWSVKKRSVCWKWSCNKVA
jgi:hypothetical protein